MTNLLNALDKYIGDLKTSIYCKDLEIEELKKKLSKMEDEVAEFEAELARVKAGDR